MTQPRCLLSVHAHPDDEASKGAPTVARYARAGVRAVLVCCTGGEEGDVHNPALLAESGPLHGLAGDDLRREVMARRPLELARSAAVIGFDEIVMLGYRDSGMKDSPANDHPESFHRAPIDEAVGRLVAIMRRARPQVVITYGDDHTGYPHPDHVRTHEVSVLAFERSGDGEWYPEAGEPWAPSKLYYSLWSRGRLEAWHREFVRLGLASPFDDSWFERPSQDASITTRIPLDGDLWKVRQEALFAHETQIDPAAPFWFGLPFDQQWKAYPFEDWILARSSVGFPAPGTFEDDLFRGIEP